MREREREERVFAVAAAGWTELKRPSYLELETHVMLCYIWSEMKDCFTH